MDLIDTLHKTFLRRVFFLCVIQATPTSASMLTALVIAYQDSYTILSVMENAGRNWKRSTAMNPKTLFPSPPPILRQHMHELFPSPSLILGLYLTVFAFYTRSGSQRTRPLSLTMDLKLLLHLSWALQTALAFHVAPWVDFTGDPGASVGARLSCFLTKCKFIGSPIGEDVTKRAASPDLIPKVTHTAVY